MTFFDVKGKFNITCIDADEREIKQSLTNELRFAGDFSPIRTVGGQLCIRNRDSHISLNSCIFVNESEAIEKRRFRKGNDESRFAFLKRTTQHVFVAD